MSSQIAFSEFGLNFFAEKLNFFPFRSLKPKTKKWRKLIEKYLSAKNTSKVYSKQSVIFQLMPTLYADWHQTPIHGLHTKQLSVPTHRNWYNDEKWSHFIPISLKSDPISQFWIESMSQMNWLRLLLSDRYLHLILSYYHLRSIGAKVIYWNEKPISGSFIKLTKLYR